MEEYLNQNKQIREDLLNSFQGISDEQLNQSIDGSDWTIMQVLHHLYLMEITVTKAIQATLTQGEKQEVDSKPIQFTVDRSRKVSAPPFVEPTTDFMTASKITMMLEQSRNDFLKLLAGTSEDALKEKAYPHPVFGLMRLDQWVPFVGYHEKRHLEQINELVAQI